MERKEINLYEEKCIQEHMPACTSSCPVHVDVRKLNSRIMQGDFNGALKTFCANVPFPRIISRICTHPCQPFCKRNEIESGIEISLLERACVENGAFPIKKLFSAPPKDKRIAVIGAGLSGLSAALALSDKGYEVCVFEKNSYPGGKILEISRSILPIGYIEEDFKVFENSRIDFYFNTYIRDKSDFEKVMKDFNAIYIADAGAPYSLLGCLSGDQSMLLPEQSTFQTFIPNVFIRDVSGTDKEYSPIEAVSSGKRAAVSIDRFVQGVSLTASRENEGPYITKLFTNIEEIKEIPRTVPLNVNEGYSKQEAMEEAGRCIQCSCLECVKACKYLQRFEKYPKKYIREISNNIAIVFGKKRSKDLINSCTMCGLCGEVCPNSLNIGEVSLLARMLMVEKGQMPPAIFDFPIRDMEYSNSEKFSMNKSQPGYEKSKYVFFPGCQLCALEMKHVEDAYLYLTRNLEDGVGLMLGCCGVPAKWSGRQEDFLNTMDRFYQEWIHSGEPEMIMACSTCYQEIKNCYPQIPLIPLWEIFNQHGLPHTQIQHSKEITIHDPCTARYESVFHNSVRDILSKLGYEVSELNFSREKTKCCGYGGLIIYANAVLAEEIIESRIQEDERDFIVYCANCKDFFSSRGKKALHILDLIYGEKQEQTFQGRSLGYSQRQENKTRLKQKLLKEIWNENMEEKKDYYGDINLDISEDVLNTAEGRHILIDDIKRTIYHGEKTGIKVYDPETGHFIAHYRPGIITYWVEYSTESGFHKVYNAYSHRLEIIEEAAAYRQRGGA